MYLHFQKKIETIAWLFVTLWVVCFLHFLTARAGFGFDACDYYIAAEDWLAGARPYRDFFQTKTPGILFLTAALFKTFSSRVEWLPWYTTAVNLSWAAAAAWAVTPVIGRRQALWVFPLSLAVSLCCMVNFWNTEQPMLLFAALGIGCWLRVEGRNHPAAEALAGVLIGIATLFKLFAVLSLASLFLLLFFSSVRSRFRSSLMLSAGFAAVMMAIGVWAWSGGILSDLWRQSVWTALVDYPAHTDYLADFLKRIGWFAIPAALGMAGSIARGLIRRDADRSQPDFLLAVLGLPYLLPLFRNQAAHYLLPFLPFAVAWFLWVCGRLAANLSISLRRGLAAAGMIALLAVLVALAFYKKSSLRRIYSGSAETDSRKACGELAKWVRDDERVIFINTGPYPHVALYWMIGRRPYPWPFLSLSGFVKKPIEKFGFEAFYRICSDPKTRILGIRLDSPMEQTLPWVYRESELKKLQRLLDEAYEPHLVFRDVWLRKGSIPAAGAFVRGPYRGDRF